MLAEKSQPKKPTVNKGRKYKFEKDGEVFKFFTSTREELWEANLEAYALLSEIQGNDQKSVYRMFLFG